MSDRVLLVSKDEIYLDRAASLLSQAHFSVQIGRTLSQALRHIDVEGPQVIVLDEQISEPEVWECCLQLRRKSQAPILITGPSADSYALIKAINQGADFYLKRPYPESEFVARIRALVRRQEFSRANINSTAVVS